MYRKVDQTTELYAKINEGKPLTKAEADIITEVVAQYASENLFTEQAQINRLAQENKTFAKRVLQWLQDKRAVFKGKTAQEREVISFLRKAEKLYSNALEQAWGAGEVAEVRHSIDKKGKNGYNYLNLPKQEYAILRKEVVRKNADYRGNYPSIDMAFTADNFYIYENYGDDSFRAIKKYNIDNNTEIINDFIEVIDNDKNIQTARDVNRVLEILKSGERRNIGNNADVARRLADNGDSLLSSRQSQSNAIRHSFESSGVERGGAGTQDRGLDTKYSLSSGQEQESPSKPNVPLKQYAKKDIADVLEQITRYSRNNIG